MIKTPSLPLFRWVFGYSPTPPGAHPFHEAGVEGHEDNVKHVEGQQHCGLIVDEETVPRETDEARD